MMRSPAIFLRWALLATALAAASPAQAIKPNEMLSDAGLESRARALSAQLRCLVCQNQSIDDSDAELAGDLRRIVRERIVAGDADPKIMTYLVARYGDFILLQPPFKTETLLLWGTPLLALLLGGWAMMQAGRKSRAPELATPLNAAEQAELQKMVDRESP